jgi:hypothetical protein
MDNGKHPRMVEKAGYATRIYGHRGASGRQCDMRSAQVQDWQQPWWELRVTRRRHLQIAES